MWLKSGSQDWLFLDSDPGISEARTDGKQVKGTTVGISHVHV